ncbi:hypothetical protein [Ancylobacter mangrovi]|uniref:hypothetical protein n=1 Tax=Ancylobacter mangrovi TaxID=2972472 RepID=UPI002161602C|nr:hypothetical protein [Ancylobacter mangrovi]MCS0502427.1 hypothetical protein [Ancylobacter mangrovi]
MGTDPVVAGAARAGHEGRRVAIRRRRAIFHYRQRRGANSASDVAAGKIGAVRLERGRLPVVTPLTSAWFVTMFCDRFMRAAD